jgi:hypothetical protein
MTEVDLAFAVIGYALGMLTTGALIVATRWWVGWRCAFCSQTNRPWHGSCRRCP